MRTQHKLFVTARCPVDSSIDVYSTMIETTEVLPVERILAAAHEFEDVTIYQEDLTQQLAEKLGADVLTEGLHSGVGTRCVAEVES